LLSSQIDGLQGCVIVGEGFFVLGVFSEIGVKNLNNIGCVDEFSSFSRILKKGCQVFPVTLLRFYSKLIFAALFSLKRLIASLASSSFLD
jgi:hypothetical protein